MGAWFSRDRRPIAFAAAALWLALGTPAEAGPVDLALVLAADTSSSMSRAEIRLQRDGYAEALHSAAVAAAIGQGPVGRIAIAYVEWSGEGATAVVVPWTLVDGSAALADVAERIRTFVPPRPRGRGVGRTSISHALQASAALFAGLPWPAGRQVIDISGDGANNDGPAVDTVRSAVLETGVTINGLPIGEARENGVDIATYYATEVIGGPGAFFEHAVTLQDFRTALERKLSREIAARRDPARRFASR